RIRLNVLTSLFKLGITAHPMIKRFVLPKRFPGSAEQPVRPQSGNSFDPLRDLAHGFTRREQQMYMVRHHDECVYFAQTSLDLGCKNYVANSRGNLRDMQRA